MFDKLVSKIKKLKDYPLNKKGTKFDMELNDLRKQLDCRVDIFGNDRIKSLETDLGIVYGEEERLLYEDNCKLNNDGLCPRLHWCGGEDSNGIGKLQSTS